MISIFFFVYIFLMDSFQILRAIFVIQVCFAEIFGRRKLIGRAELLLSLRQTCSDLFELREASQVIKLSTKYLAYKELTMHQSSFDHRCFSSAGRGWHRPLHTYVPLGCSF